MFVRTSRQIQVRVAREENVHSTTMSGLETLRMMGNRIVEKKQNHRSREMTVVSLYAELKHITNDNV